jgi:diacylglycerol kinase (ATP)
MDAMFAMSPLTLASTTSRERTGNLPTNGLNRLSFQMQHSRPQTLHVIVNPAQEHGVSLLERLNQQLRPAGIRWQVSVTHEAGDATRHTKNALETGVDLIGVYGGDGTVMEVADCLAETGKPLLIIPGGTGNLMATELKIPTTIEGACRRITEDTFQTRSIDMGRMDSRHFLLRAGCGFESAVLQDATREMKNQYGKWAYVFAMIKALQRVPVATYWLTFDGGDTIEARGVACVVANAGVIGLGNLTLAQNVGVDDGKLDCILIRSAHLDGIFELATKIMGLHKNRSMTPESGIDASHLVNHWQVRKVTIESEPQLQLQADGDLIAALTPQTIEAVPRALNVVV